MNTKKKHFRSTRLGKLNWRRDFLKALNEMPNVSRACDMAKVSQTLVYMHRNKDAEFKAQWEGAIVHSIELLEKACWDRANKGTRKPIWMKDEEGIPVMVDEVRDYSDTLAIFLLKNYAPQKFRDRVYTELSGPDGGPIRTKEENPLKGIPLERLRELAAGRINLFDNGEAKEEVKGNGSSNNGH